ncbi:hypothetical protein Chor_001862 [Crotalus horridus]
MKKYAKSSVGETVYGGSDELSDDITQQQLLPGVKDPNLWTVKCKIGEERSTAVALMRKFIAYQFTDTPLQIKSVVAPEHVKGYIYVEAYKQTHVKQAIEGVGNLRMGYWNQQMVPIKEMTDVLKVVKEMTNLKPKSWVRLKRGIYKGDIAQVDYVEPSQNQISLKMIPRIDFDRIKARMSQKDWVAKWKKFKRPPQRLFDAEKIRSLGGDVASDGDFLIFEGNRYSRKGFLFKSFAMLAVITEGVKPTLSELEKFEDQPEGIDLEVVTESTGAVGVWQVRQGSSPLPVVVSGKEREHNFQPGDNVEDMLEFPAQELRKYFKTGDHVKVIAGRFEGDTGLIVRVEENFLCSETASGVDVGGQHELGELVLLDPQTVGVIVRLERETFQVLSMNNQLVTVRHQAVNRKKDNRFAVSLDSEQNNIHVKDIVKVIEGSHSLNLIRRQLQPGPPQPFELGVQFQVSKERLASAPRDSKKPSGMPSGYGRTPMYGSQTPMYGSGSRTPMYGTQHDGNRTPHYGSQTPLHDGSRTPAQSGAWDPNTPSRTEEEFDYGFDDEPTPSPQGYGATPNPQTPGYPDPSSPQVNPPYNPQTPGTPAMYNTDQFSPYAVPSPQGSYQPSPSPQSFHPVAPSPASPSPSPVGYSPMTPGAPSPGAYNPHTPGSGIEQSSSDWVTTDIEVKVHDTYLDSHVVGKTGVIRSVNGGMCSVYVKKCEKVVSISSEHLEPVTPAKNDKVKVLLGEDREATGMLLSIDGEDGIVRMNPEEQLRILNLRFLGKLVAA